MRGLGWLIVAVALTACDEERAAQLTIFDDGTAVTYSCRFDADNETRVTTTTTAAATAEACLGLSRNGCVASPQPGDAACASAGQNTLLNTCVESFFACLSPVGACSEADGVVTYSNGARVEATPGYKLFGPGDPNPCVIGQSDGDATIVYLARDGR